jgi:hypothetical protein
MVFAQIFYCTDEVSMVFAQIFYCIGEVSMVFAQTFLRIVTGPQDRMFVKILGGQRNR